MRKVLPVFLFLLAGCTERWIQVRSEPPGAEVYLDGRHIGKTPCETRFIWYGERELVLERDRYQTLTEIVRFRAPWWQWPVIDLFPDFLLPWTFTDRHTVSFSLQERTFDLSEREKLRERAEEMRKKLEEDP